jgi:hypothetical protein
LAGLFGAILFFALAAVDQAVSRGAERKTFQRQLELNDHALQDAFNEIDMIRSRLVSLETDTQQSVDAGVAPVHQDLQAIGALLAQVTEAVSDTDHRMVTLEEQVKGMARAASARTARCHAKQAADEVGAAPEPTVSEATVKNQPSWMPKRPNGAPRHWKKSAQGPAEARRLGR